MSPVQTSNIALSKINIWSPDSGGHFSEIHIMMELYGFKTEGQREAMLLSKRSCPHWLVIHTKSWNSFLHCWLCAGWVQASTCNLFQRLSEIHCIYFGESGLIDMVPKDWYLWEVVLLTAAHHRHILQTAGALVNLSAPPRNKVISAKSADSPDKKKTSFLFLWLQQPLRKI